MARSLADRTFQLRPGMPGMPGMGLAMPKAGGTPLPGMPGIPGSAGGTPLPGLAPPGGPPLPGPLAAEK